MPKPKALTINAAPTSTATIPNESAVDRIHISRNDDMSTHDDDDNDRNIEFSFHSRDEQQTPDTWVLLDNQYTVDFSV